MWTFGGVFKSVEINASEIKDILDGKVMIDGSNIAGCSGIKNADAFLSPDIDSFRMMPYFDTEDGKVAMFMCSILKPDKKPFEGCVRTILRKKLEHMKMLGYSKMNVGFEPEFIILKNKPVSNFDLDFLDEGCYHSNEFEDLGAEIRRKIICELEKIGIHCLTSHHECGPSQYEITFKYSDAITSCDNLMITRFMIKTIAKNYGLYATFMPKIDSNVAGNGLHTNISLEKDGKNDFASDFGLSLTAKKFVTGILNHAKEICLLTNPSINSFKRLVRGFEAPVNICWSNANRSAMIRIPKATGNATRIEVRNVDSSSNPYLAVFVLLSAGLDGIVKNMPIIKQTDLNVYELNEKELKDLKLDYLPRNLMEAVLCFKNSKFIDNLFCSEVRSLILRKEEKEIENYNRYVNSFDFENYF